MVMVWARFNSLSLLSDPGGVSPMNANHEGLVFV